MTSSRPPNQGSSPGLTGDPVSRGGRGQIEGRGVLNGPVKPGHDRGAMRAMCRFTATRALTPRATCRSAWHSNRCDLLAVRGGVAGGGVDDGEVAHDADDDVVRVQIADCDRPCRLLQEGGAVDPRLVGIGAIELRREDLVEMLNVAILHGG